MLILNVHQYKGLTTNIFKGRYDSSVDPAILSMLYIKENKDEISYLAWYKMDGGDVVPIRKLTGSPLVC